MCQPVRRRKLLQNVTESGCFPPEMINIAEVQPPLFNERN